MKTSSLALLLVLLIPFGYGAEGDVVKVGQAAPVFSGASIDGSKVELQSFAGKVVLLNFFATWCGPCMEEMPRLESEVWQRYRDAGLVVIGVGREHDIPELTQFIKSKRFTFQILADPKRDIYSKYATQYIPRCYLIGKDGKVKYAAMGYDPIEFDGLKNLIAAELKK